MEASGLAEAALDRAAVSAVDQADQMADVLAMGEHLRDAVWRAESAALMEIDCPGGVIVAGMGGSGIGGVLAREALGDRASRPVLVTRDYGLPPWATPDTAVLCASYSGNTEETLAAFEAAGALGAYRVVTTTGGALAEAARAEGVPVIPIPAALQPRAASAYMTVAALEVAAACGAAPRLHSEIDVAAGQIEALCLEWGPEGADDGEPKALARALHGSVPQIAGAGLTTPVAYRWKTQINENAKIPCSAHELPELDHNEIVGWEGASSLGRFAAVFLQDSDLHPRVRERIALTRELIEPYAASTHIVESRGDNRVSRLFSLVLQGDLVSLYLAVMRGVDPSPVAVIEELKRRLAG